MCRTAGDNSVLHHRHGASARSYVPRSVCTSSRWPDVPEEAHESEAKSDPRPAAYRWKLSQPSDKATSGNDAMYLHCHIHNKLRQSS